MLYTAVTQHLGFNYFEEGTVMALAATGDKTYAKKFGELIRLGAAGEFFVNRDFINYHTHGLIQPFKKRFVDDFGPRREKGEPFGDVIAISLTRCSTQSRKPSFTSFGRSQKSTRVAIYA